jgi:LmbE family N-acetylglucosaminyl deacetylase
MAASVTAMTGGLASSFVVDAEHLGTSEAAWSASPGLAAVLPLDIPPVDHLLMIAPHPDDEILGAGGLLQVVAARGVRVEICAVTDGEGFHPSWESEHLRRTRTAESLTALGRLGLPRDAPRLRLGYGDGRVASRETELAERLADRLGPNSLCVAPWRKDGHPDHDACGRAAAAASDAMGAGLFEYVVWAWHWADPLGADLPWASCRRLDLERRQRARKRWATGTFRSQTRPFGPDGDAPPVLPAPVLRRFWRSFEVYIT